MAAASAVLGSCLSGSVRVVVAYDDATFVVSGISACNNSGSRCRVSFWRTGQEAQAIVAIINASGSATGKPTGTVTYQPTENGDGVTPAGNIFLRLEYPF